jgi:hypothetical protein
MTFQSPRVSVVLPVYNGLPYLHAAISSILSQSFEDFELIVIDDGSVDGSASVLDDFNDQRIRFFQQANQGLARTLNHGISLACGTYVARQDADDLSHPDRLAMQVAHMEAQPDCVLLGTWAEIIEVDRRVNRFHRHSVEDAELRYLMLFNNPFVHSSVMLRKSSLTRVGGYTTEPDRQLTEDFELWSRLARVGSIANLGEVLVSYREIPGSLSRTGGAPYLHCVIKICSENLAAASGLACDDPEIRAIAALAHGALVEVRTRPDFSRMQSILLASIHPSAPEPLASALRQDALARIQAMQAGWLIRESPAYDFLHRPGPIRNVAKRVWRLAKRFRRA